MTMTVNRRNFLRTMIGGVAAGAAVRTWPFRVFSFPSEIVKPPLIWKALGATSGNYIDEILIPIQPMYDFYSVGVDWKGQTLFNLPRDTGHEPRVTE